MIRLSKPAGAFLALVLVAAGYAAASWKKPARVPVTLEPVVVAVQEEPAQPSEPVRLPASYAKPVKAPVMPMEPVIFSDAVLAGKPPLSKDALLMARDFCRSGDSPVLEEVNRLWPRASERERDAVLPLANGAAPCVAAVLFNLHAADRFTAADVRQWIKDGLVPPDDLE